MKKNMMSVLLLLLVSLGAESSEPRAYELPRTQVIPLQASVSRKQYELIIKLPEEYAEKSDVKHPVIYFTDADWHIEILGASAEYLMPEAILVGISWRKDMKKELVDQAGPHVSRFQDYTVRKASNPEIQEKYEMGQAGSFLQFIRDDVIRTVEANYRTDPNSRTYFGYSLGGLFGAYILMTQPGTFSNYILGSPSLDRDMTYFSELAADEAIKRKKLDVNVFISHGSLESELAGKINEYVGLLNSRNDESLNLDYSVIDGSHQTAFPLTGVRSVTWLSGLGSK